MLSLQVNATDKAFKLRGGKLQRQCDCKMRNGLQSDCKRYSHGKRVVCKCLPLPEILAPAGQPSYPVVPLNVREIYILKRGPGCEY